MSEAAGSDNFLNVGAKFKTHTFGLLDCFPLKVTLWHLVSSLQLLTQEILLEFGMVLPTKTLFGSGKITEPVPVLWVGALIKSLPWKNRRPHRLDSVFHVKN